MSIRPLAGTRVSLLVCDTCDAVLGIDGSSTQKTFAESDPSDLAPHYAGKDELAPRASRAGWTSERDGWSCPRCSRAPKMT